MKLIVLNQLSMGTDLASLHGKVGLECSCGGSIRTTKIRKIRLPYFVMDYVQLQYQTVHNASGWSATDRGNP